MRLLRLDFIDEFTKLDLHPLVTIIQATSVDKQLRLIESLRKLSTGSTSGITGLVEHAGLLFELDGSAQTELPKFGTKKEVVAYFGGSAYRNPSGLFQSELSESERGLEIAAVNLEELRADLDFGLKAELYKLRQELAFTDGDFEVVSGISSSEKRLETVRRIYQDSVSEPVNIIEYPEGVQELKERWISYTENKDKVESSLSYQFNLVEKLTDELQSAKDNEKAAIENSKPKLLSSEDESRLEALSDLESDKTRKGKWRNQLTPEETEELQSLLSKVGVENATAYSLFRLNPKPTAAQLRFLEETKSKRTYAENKLEEGKKLISEDKRYSSMVAEGVAIRSEAQNYLGFMIPADIGLALDGLAEKKENPLWAAKVDSLRDILSNNELNPPRDLLPHEILEWTDSWLRGEASVSDPDGQLVFDREATLDKIVGLERKLIRHSRAVRRIAIVEREHSVASKKLSKLRSTIFDLDSEELNSDIHSIKSGIVKLAEAGLESTENTVPIALVSDFENITSAELKRLLDSIAELSHKLQFILISERSEAVDWAENVGLENASVVVERSRVGV